MKKILAATSFVLLSLCASPSYAKSLWLKCRHRVINLDTDRQQYTIERGEKVVQGKASFFPNQINFEHLLHEDDYTLFGKNYTSGRRTDYVINRKTLEYTITDMKKVVRDMFPDIPGSPRFIVREWVIDDPLHSSLPNPETGVCKLIPNPNQGNKI